MNSMNKYKKILVTGGCGFIGSHFIRLILEEPEVEVLNLDVLTYAGNPDNLVDIVATKADRYRHLKVNICDSELIKKNINEFSPDVVVHFAAESHVDRSYFDAFDFVRTNIEGTRVLLESIRQSGKDIRFVYISTDEVYGDIEDGLYSDEQSPMRPSNLYAASKAGADLFVQSFIRTHSFPAVILRGSNNYGTHQYPEKLIPMAITNLLENKEIPLHGDGSHQRSWLHVNDFCSAISLVMRQAADGTIWNVSGEIKSNLEVVKTVANILSVSIEDKLKKVPDRPGADFRYAPSSEQIRTQLGWKPEHIFSKEISHIINWYKANELWCKHIKTSEEFLRHYKKQAMGKWF